MSKLMQHYKSIMQNPILNGWGFIIGILGLVAAGYQIWDSRSFPNLTAQVHSIRTLLVSKEGSQDLKIYASDKLIKESVTAAQIAFWNAGRAPVKSDDVLQAITLTTIPPSPILSAKVLRSTRDIIGLTIDDTKAGEGILTIRFRILENQDGALIQVTYIGDEKVAFIGGGAVVGQQSFKVYEHPSRSEQPKINSRPNQTLLLITSVVGLAIGLFLTLSFSKDIVEIWSKNLEAPKTRLQQISVTLFAVALIFVMWWWMWKVILNRVTFSAPPFQFL